MKTAMTVAVTIIGVGMGALHGCAAGNSDAAGDAAVPDGASDDGNDFMGDATSCTSTVAHCSDDLHTYVDGCGHILVTCPADQGCIPNGTCVPACAAAATNKSSVGCEYYAVKPSDFGAASCFAAFVANTWGSPLHVTVDRGGVPMNGLGYIPSGSGTSVTYAPLTGGVIPPDQVAIFFLASGPRPPPMGFVGAECPPGVNVGFEPDTSSQEGTGLYQAFHVTADAPVVAYDMGPYGGGSSAFAGATLLLPTSVWDVNYVATSGWSSPLTSYSPWIGVVAQADGTDVTIVPTADVVGAGGVASATKNAPKVYSLLKGQVLRLYQPADLSGSIIQANKPIGSWAGHGCTDIESGACDSIHVQIPPVQALGSEYVAVRYRNRHPAGAEESPPWRFVGVVKGTTLTYDPPQSGAPPTLDIGQVAEFDASGPFVVSSQDSSHPFFFGAHMTGALKVSTSDALGHVGDPELVDVIPPTQYLSRYIFFTDPTYPETNLVFVRQKGTDGSYHDVNLDCLGTLTGWQPIGSGGKYEYARADVQTGNFQKVGSCDLGRHLASSDVSFALTVWGWGTAATGSNPFSQYVSYGYPAGASVKPINSVVVPPVPN